MNIKTIKTRKIEPNEMNIEAFLDLYLPKNILEKSVIAIASKIISLCEGNVFLKSKIDKNVLAENEGDFVSEKTNEGVFFGVKDGALLPFSGVDESNSGDYYITLPSNSQNTANFIREYICQKYDKRYIGVIITDGMLLPLRWGAIGFCIAHSGFIGIKDYRNTKDIYGNNFKLQQMNIRDGLASSVCVEMGEGAESQPISIITDVNFIEFQDRNPKKSELEKLIAPIDKDIYGPFIKNSLRRTKI